MAEWTATHRPALYLKSLSATLRYCDRLLDKVSMIRSRFRSTLCSLSVLFGDESQRLARRPDAQSEKT